VNDLFGPASFLVVADGVYFIANRARGTAAAAQARGEYSIRFLLFATGESRGIARIGQPDDLGLAVSPDGRELLYPQRDQLEADLILQDFR
jgi:hypothetical protein